MIGGQILHALRFFAGVDSPSTQTTFAERTAIGCYATGARVAVEIGVFEGRTTRVIAEAMDPAGMLYAIDPFMPGRLGVCWGEVIAKRYISSSQRKQNVTFVKALSHNAVGTLNLKIDFLFIDGDHSYEGLSRDWRGWSKLIRESGFVALHDTAIPDHNLAVGSYGAYQVFSELIRNDGRFRLVETIDSMNVLQRI